MKSKQIKGKDFIGVGVGAVIINERDEVLLLLRKNSPESGAWTIPGGAVEWFERCEDAIVRECQEELGVQVRVDRFLAVVDHIVPVEQIHWVSVEYLCSVVAGRARNIGTDENSAMRWFSVSGLPANLTQPTRVALSAYMALK